MPRTNTSGNSIGQCKQCLRRLGRRAFGQQLSAPGTKSVSQVPPPVLGLVRIQRDCERPGQILQLDIEPFGLPAWLIAAPAIRSPISRTPPSASSASRCSRAFASASRMSLTVKLLIRAASEPRS